jgi:glycosyltransferase involved in cell wall biosynthesis
MEIVLAYYPIPHHAGRSGYHQLATQLQEHAGATSLRVGRVPRLPASARRVLIGQAGLVWYDEWALALEVAAAQSLLTRQGTLHHWLYAEDNFAHAGWLRPLARARRNRLVASFHQPPASFERVHRRPRALRELDAVLALSRAQADYLAGRAGPDRVFLVPHGVDTDFYFPDAESEKGAPTPFTCLCVGSWLRDFATLRTVIEEIGATDPEIRFVLVSPEGEFAGFPNVEVRSGLGDEELRASYRTAGLLVLPLLDSTANNSLLEALACGVPIITTAVGGVVDYVDETCAVLVPPGHADAIASAIKALAADDNRRRELSRHARKRALDLAWPRVAERVLDVYEAIA